MTARTILSAGIEPHVQAMRDALQSRPTADEFEQQVRPLYEAILARNADLGRGGPEMAFLEFCSFVLATRDMLTAAGWQPQTIMKLLTDVFVEGRRSQMKGWLKLRFNVDSEAPRQAFVELRRNFKAKGETMFGDTFHYVQPIKDDDRTEIHVQKCFFNDFFRRNSAPELTSLMCAIDTVWGDELNSGPYNAFFTRPTILSEGDDVCRFVFHRR